jgi:hypothetical protein
MRGLYILCGDLLHDPEPVSERAGGDVATRPTESPTPKKRFPLSCASRSARFCFALRLMEALPRLAVRREEKDIQNGLGN